MHVKRATVLLEYNGHLRPLFMNYKYNITAALVPAGPRESSHNVNELTSDLITLLGPKG